MQGDFSWWGGVAGRNLAGVLHQQGRVLLDRDWNDQARLTAEWQDMAAREAIGAGVLAVSAHHADSFRVVEARVLAGRVLVSALPGNAWADGLAVTLPGEAGEPVELVADYFGTDVQAVPGDAGSIADGVRDAVILEVWRETLSAFQVPEELLEPALGGPDTTERLLTTMRFRLFRMIPGEDCHTIDLGDRPRGTLTAALRPSTTVGGDCPVTDAGGYEGLEHHLYRVEIAATGTGVDPSFKWSRFNGGLVGRGESHLDDAADRRITLGANGQAIRATGQAAFYLEVVVLDAERGHWRVGYGARVTLDGDELRVGGDANERFVDGVRPTGEVFFRLWDDIRPLADFPAPADPDDRVELRDGILLEFAGAASTYRPGDYWTFPVRAGGIDNPLTPVDDQLPEGVVYHRVPVAELMWDADDEVSLEEETIEDCRRIFRPLVDQGCCCTFTVGDGVFSHGHFGSIAEAVRHLPATGGKVCVLPGVHRATVRVEGRENVEISGCGLRSLVVPGEEDPDEPIFFVANSTNVAITHLAMVHHTGTAVQLVDDPEEPPSREFRVERCRILATVHAVEVRVRNDLSGDNDVAIADNRIGLHDTDAGRATLFVSADGVRIERNRLVVVHVPDDGDGGGDQPPPPPDDDPCEDPADSYDDPHGSLFYAYQLFHWLAIAQPGPAGYRALGGIQIGGGSERVRIVENEVQGGRWNAITLGDFPPGAESLEGAVFVQAVEGPAAEALRAEWPAVLYEVDIARNVLVGMDACGIGVAAFFDPDLLDVLVRVERLSIYHNRIMHCLRRPPELPSGMAAHAALGGIALADCGDLTIRNNRVDDNGAETREPVCGVFVLVAERAEISENMVLRNGPSTDVPDDDLREGARAGIVLGMSLGRLLSDLFGAGDEDEDRPPPHGVPAARVHENVVVQPIGQALAIGAIGPVSVQGNSLVSQGVDPSASLSRVAGAVLIFDLGISKDLLALVVLLSFAQTDSVKTDSLTSANRTSPFIPLLYGPSGNVLFTGNQVMLDLRRGRPGFALSSILIVSLDDVGFGDNQSEVASILFAAQGFDIVLANTLVAAVTARATDSRFQDGLTLLFWSLVTVGLLNTTTMNQATHCILALGSRKIQAGNMVIYDNDCQEPTANLEVQPG